MFYGWWIVAAGFSLETLIGTLMFRAYGAYSTGLGATAVLALVRYQARHRREAPDPRGGVRRLMTS